MAFIRINQIKDADGSIEPDELELANDIIEAMMITKKRIYPWKPGIRSDTDLHRHARAGRNQHDHSGARRGNG